MRVSKIFILPAALLVGCTTGFPVLDTRRHSNVGLSSSVSSNNNHHVPSDDMIRKDIEAMREEAKERLELLSHQMEDIQKQHEVHHHLQEAETSAFPGAQAFEEAKPPLTTQALELPSHTTIETKEEQTKVQQLAPPRKFIDSSLLHGTRWKVVVQVGSPRYNAALAEASEKPLLVHLVVEFTPERLKKGDELLQGLGASVLEVKEAWVGASSLTEGRQRPVQIKSTGGWKVLVGQGPKGIDILRFYVDIAEEICHDKESSTLRCPAARIYLTSGFFSMENHNEAEAFKDYLRDELGRLVSQYEDLQMEDENDEALFSFDAFKRAKQLMELRQEIKAMNQKITQARIKDPEKAMLRLSRKGDVGVTKEGQVCYKDDSQGPPAGYLVLGKMEMASINKPIVEAASDPNILRP